MTNKLLRSSSPTVPPQPVVTTPIPVALALGSNLGNRAQNLEKAIEHLTHDIVQNLVTSSFYYFAPVDCPPKSPIFLNAALTGTTRYSAFDLLKRCQNIERELGRPAVHGYHENRTIDIDILIYGDMSLTSDRLTIPHPELTRREFVLKPLSEIAPTWPVGAEGKPVKAHLHNLKNRAIG